MCLLAILPKMKHFNRFAWLCPMVLFAFFQHSSFTR